MSQRLQCNKHRILRHTQRAGQTLILAEVAVRVQLSVAAAGANNFAPTAPNAAIRQSFPAAPTSPRLSQVRS